MALLPSQFSDLETYAQWSVGTESERVKIINARSDAELRAFYDAMLPRMDAVAEHLNAFRLDKLPEEEMALFNLAKMMMEASTIAENGRSIIGQYFDFKRFIPIDETGGPHGNRT